MSAALPEEHREPGRPPSCPPELTERIIRMREAGCSYEGIAGVLNAESVPLPCGGSRWLKSSIDRILHTRYATRLAVALSALPSEAAEQPHATHDSPTQHADGQHIIPNGPAQKHNPRISPSAFRTACAAGRITSDGTGCFGEGRMAEQSQANDVVGTEQGTADGTYDRAGCGGRHSLPGTTGTGKTSPVANLTYAGPPSRAFAMGPPTERIIINPDAPELRPPTEAHLVIGQFLKDLRDREPNATVRISVPALNAGEVAFPTGVPVELYVALVRSFMVGYAAKLSAPDEPPKTSDVSAPPRSSSR